VQVFVGGRAQWFEPEVIDDKQPDVDQAAQPALVGPGCASGVQACRELCAGGEQYIDALTHGAMA
jgi:hypothetical protein